MTSRKFKKNEELNKDNIRALMIINKGSFRRIYDGKTTDTLGIGDVIGLALAMGQLRGDITFKANGSAEVFEIPMIAIQNIPTVRWKLFEEYRRRRRIISLGDISS